jgi:hypothetical protein
MLEIGKLNPDRMKIGLSTKKVGGEGLLLGGADR